MYLSLTRIRLAGIVVALCCLLHHVGICSTDIAALQAKLATATTDTAKLKALDNLHQASYVNSAREALDYANQMLELARKLDMPEYIATGHMRIGITHWRIGNYPDAIRELLTALPLYEQLGDSASSAWVLNNIAVVYNGQGNYNEALKYGQRALELRKQLGQNSGIAGSYNNIAVVYSNKGEYEEAIDYFKKALDINIQMNDSANIAHLYNNIGALYRMLGELDQALSFLNDGFKVIEQSNDTYALASCYHNMADVYKDRKEYLKSLEYNRRSLELKKTAGNKDGIMSSYLNLGDLYADQHNYVKAREYYEEGWQLAKEIGDQRREVTALVEIGEIYMQEGKYAEAITFLQQSNEKAQAINTRDLLQRGLLLLANCYEKAGMTDKAYNSFKDYTAVKDSVMSAATREKVVELKVQYETEKKEDELRIKNQELKILSKEREFDRLRLMAAGIGFVLLLVAGVALYSRQKIKREKEKKLFQTSQRLMKVELDNQLLEREKILREMQIKEKELTDFSLLLVQRNKMLDQFKSELQGLKYSMSLESIMQKVHRCISFINQHLNVEETRSEFQLYSEQQQVFLNHLQEKHPDLTENERKLAILLRLNFSSKEIASILNITPKSVDMNRYRLRKKLGIETHDNLADFFRKV